DSLAQSLTLALETQLGSDPVNVVFGFDLRALGENPYGVTTRREYLRLQLVRTVASDPRVKEIRDLYFDDDPRGRTSRRTTATIVVETRSAEQLALKAGVPIA